MELARSRLGVAAGIVIAIVLCIWFGWLARQAGATDRASAALQSGRNLTHADAQRIRGQLHTAGQLNPDTTITVLRAELASELGDRHAAVRLLLTVVGKEPDNASAWQDLARVASTYHVEAESLLAIRRLVHGSLTG
jgi:predicted Zn-dependent protease